MRRREFSMDGREALELLRRAPLIHLASTTEDGAPVLRTLNAVVVGEWILFHGSRVGEKVECLGRPAVVSAEEVVAFVPSYFVNPTLACPATTLYQSVQVHGLFERIDDLDLKAQMLEALMQKYQPEGGYTPIERDAPEYARVVRGILVCGVRIDNITGKKKLGQNRSNKELESILDKLWERGGPGDPEAIEQIVAANPEVPLPAFLQAPEGTRLVCALGPADLEAAVELVLHEYWRRGCTATEVRAALSHSSALVGARAPNGELIATARAVSDRAWHAYVADVAVNRHWRGRGIGRAVMKLLLQHPALRKAAVVRLGTADAQRFYGELGFIEAGKVDLGFAATSMVKISETRLAALRRGGHGGDRVNPVD